MTIFGDIGCALFGCSEAMTTPVVKKVVSRMKAVADVSCDAKQVIVQDTTCSLISKGCPGLTMTCVNDATQSANCSLSQLASAASEALLAYANGPGLRRALSLDPGAGDTTVEVAIKNSITNTCSSSDSIRQQLTSDVTCKYSKYVDIAAIANASQASACSVAAAIGLAQAAENEQPDEDNPGGRGRMILGVAVGVYFILLIGLVFWIRSMGGAPARIKILRS